MCLLSCQNLIYLTQINRNVTKYLINLVLNHVSACAYRVSINNYQEEEKLDAIYI